MVLNFWSSEGKHESDLKSTERERKAESNYGRIKKIKMTESSKKVRQ